jgi:hypothetical protein
VDERAMNQSGLFSEAILAALSEGSMQDPGYELPRIPLLRRWMDRARKGPE